MTGFIVQLSARWYKRYHAKLAPRD